MDIDSSYDAARKIFENAELNISNIETEQDARLQLIDRTLIEILGWSHNEIKTEPFSDSGYADYLLSTRGAHRLVVEAKRTSHVLVDTKNPKLAQYKISGPALSSATPGIRQAVSYSMDHGVSYASLTNGTSWLTFLTFPGNGVSYKEGYAFVFPSLASILDNFATFHDLLSKERVATKTYALNFAKAGGLSVAEFEPMVAVNRESDLRLLRKSELANDLEPIFREFFGALSGDNDREMLVKCFVETRESKVADANLEKIVRNISANIETIASSAGEQLAQEIEEAVATGRGETVVIVGNKGSGKSTFVVACTRFRRHRVRCFNGTGGGSWRGGSLHASSSLRLCG